jgi:hypothetical protein
VGCIILDTKEGAQVVNELKEELKAIENKLGSLRGFL